MSGSNQVAIVHGGGTPNAVQARSAAAMQDIEHEEAAAAAAASSVATDDPDLAALLAARAAVNQTAAMPAPTAAARPVQAAQQPGPVPYARFSEVNARAAEMERQALYWRGRAEAGRAANQPAPADAERQNQNPTAQQTQAALVTRLSHAEGNYREAIKKWEAGDISGDELAVATLQKDGAILDAREALFLLRLREMLPSMVQTQTGVADQQILDAQIDDLAEKFPAIGRCTPQQQQWLAALARQEATLLGKPFSTSSIDLMRLREATALLAEKFVPSWYPDYVTPALRDGANPAGPAQAPQARRTSTNLRPSPGYAQIGSPDFEESDNTDYSNRPALGFGRMIGMVKPQFISLTDITNGVPTKQDFGVTSFYHAISAA